MGLDEAGIELQSPAVAGGRFIGLPQLVQGVGQIEVGLGKVRRQLPGSAVAAYRFARPPHCAIRLAQAVVKGGDVLLKLDRPPDVPDGLFVLAHAVGQHAEKVPRIGPVRLGGQDVPVNLLGLGQPAGLMVMKRNSARASEVVPMGGMTECWKLDA